MNKRTEGNITKKEKEKEKHDGAAEGKLNWTVSSGALKAGGTYSRKKN